MVTIATLKSALKARQAEEAAKAVKPEPEEPAAIPPPRFVMHAPGIAKQMAEVKAELGRLETDHAQASLDAVLDGAAEAALKLQGIRASLDATKDKLRTLQAAYDVALVKDRVTERQCAAELAKSQLRAIQAHLTARDKAATALREALEAAAEAWRVLIARSEKAPRAKPITWKGDWAAGSLCDFASLHSLVAQEIFRVAGDPSLGNRRSFPGAKAQSIQNLGQPEKIEPLDEAIKRASTHTLGVLAGRIAE